jgi:uncharacterized protein DUF4154
MLLKHSHNIRWLLRVVVGLCCGVVYTCQSQAETTPRETSHYEIIAKFLYAFSIHTEWPQEAFHGQDSPFIVGILGEDPFKHDIDAIKGQIVNGRKLEVRYPQNLKEAKGCQLLFISSSEEKRVPEILKALEGTSILTVAEMEGFAEKNGMNGMISIVVEVREGTTRKFGKPRLQINRERAEKAGLTINSRVLDLARK